MRYFSLVLISYLFLSGVKSKNLPFIENFYIPDSTLQINDSLESFENASYGLSTVFESDSLLTITIETHITELIHDIQNQRSYHQGVARFNSLKGEIILPIQLKTAGNLRRRPSTCNFPPLSIKFIETGNCNSPFVNNRKYKLITHCLTYSPVYEQYVIQEYLIYRLYNLLTDKSFKARLLKINWVDASGKNKTAEKFALLLEPVDEFACRQDGKLLKIKKIPPDAINRKQTTLITMFEYLIGNTDWSIKALHNIRMFQNIGLQPYPVPYDFDYSGLINAQYAVSAPELNLSTVRERYYNGFCRHPQEIEEIINFFNEKKESIYQLFLNCPYLSKQNKKLDLKYLDQFYRIINNPKTVKYVFIDNCRFE